MTDQRVHTAGILVLSAAILLNLFTDVAQLSEPLVWFMVMVSVLLMVLGFVMRRREQQRVDEPQEPA